MPILKVWLASAMFKPARNMRETMPDSIVLGGLLWASPICLMDFRESLHT